MMPSELTSDPNFAVAVPRVGDGHAAWQPDGAGLAALVDIGLTRSTLARYFRVSESDIAGWFDSGGIALPQ